MRTRTQQNKRPAAGSAADPEFALAIVALKRDSAHGGGGEAVLPQRLVFAYNPKRDVIASIGEDHGFLDHLDWKTGKALVVGMLVGSPNFMPESAETADGLVVFNLDALNNSEPGAVVKAAQHLERFINPEKPVSFLGDRSWAIRRQPGDRLPQTLRELAHEETESSDS